MRTKYKKWIYAALVVLFLFSIMSGGRFPYLIYYTLIMTIAFMYFMLFRNEVNLFKYFYLDQEVYEVGEDLEVRYNIVNEGFLPVVYCKADFLASKELGGMALELGTSYVGPMDSVGYRKQFYLKHRGYFRLGEIELTIKDPLGFFERKVKHDKNILLTVYPRVRHVSELSLPARDFFGKIEVDLKTHEDFSNVERIRDYHEGDSLKKIHWKVSAKTNELKVKEFKLAADTKINVFFNGFQGDYPEYDDRMLEENAVEYAATILSFLLEREIETNLILNGYRRDVTNGKNSYSMPLFLNALTGFDAQSQITFDEFIKNETQKIIMGTSIVAITPTIDGALFELLLRIARRNLDIYMVVFRADQKVDPELKNRIEGLKASGIHVNLVTSLRDLYLDGGA